MDDLLQAIRNLQGFVVPNLTHRIASLESALAKADALLEARFIQLRLYYNNWYFLHASQSKQKTYKQKSGQVRRGQILTVS